MACTDAVSPRPTQDASLDTFQLAYILGPVAVLALIFNYAYTPFEIVWSFSIWLESVAILPQLFMLQRTGEAETITTHYLAALGLYRALYIPNWMYRWVQLWHTGFRLAWALISKRPLLIYYADTSARAHSTRSQ